MIVLYLFALSYALWVFYLAVMNLKRVRDNGQLTKAAMVFAYPVLWVGLALDVLANVLVLTIIMLELPKEMLVTARLQRHVKDETWRGAVARWFGKNLLDPFDPSGRHLD